MPLTSKFSAVLMCLLLFVSACASDEGNSVAAVPPDRVQNEQQTAVPQSTFSQVAPIPTATSPVPIVDATATGTTPPLPPALHPQVQQQAMERVEAIVEEHSDAWPWVLLALDVAQMSFFEKLPAECENAIGCYNHATGDIWLSLVALRGGVPSEIVLHELAHAFTRSYPAGEELLDRFADHYAGCSIRSLDPSHLASELLADTMAMVAATEGSYLPTNFGYFGGVFAGCLADSSRPDGVLVQDVYSALFNCDSDLALDILDDLIISNGYAVRILGLGLSSSFSADDFVLLVCYGIDCTASPIECELVTQEDLRRDNAERRLHDRRCADGLLFPGDWILERPGWEAGCEDFIPDDIECTFTEGGLGGHRPGSLDESGQCSSID